MTVPTHFVLMATHGERDSGDIHIGFIVTITHVKREASTRCTRRKARHDKRHLRKAHWTCGGGGLAGPVFALMVSMQ